MRKQEYKVTTYPSTASPKRELHSGCIRRAVQGEVE